MKNHISFKRLFRKQKPNKISRVDRIRNILKNLSNANDFDLWCWLQFAPQDYKHMYSFEEVIDEIDRSQWDGERVFSSEALNPIHKHSKLAYFPIEDMKVVKIIRAKRDIFYIGYYIFSNYH